jgi:hypothetical protein
MPGEGSTFPSMSSSNVVTDALASAYAAIAGGATTVLDANSADASSAGQAGELSRESIAGTYEAMCSRRSMPPPRSYACLPLALRDGDARGIPRH